MKRPVSTETWTQIAAGTLLLAVLAYVGWFRALFSGGLISAAVMIVVLLIGLFVIAAIWPVVYRLISHLFFGDPYWIRPREFDTEDDPVKTRSLDARLDLVEVDGQAKLWQDRETGQFWASRRFLARHGVFTRFKPLKKREHWSGMADDQWSSGD